MFYPEGATGCDQVKGGTAFSALVGHGRDFPHVMETDLRNKGANPANPTSAGRKPDRVLRRGSRWVTLLWGGFDSCDA